MSAQVTDEYLQFIRGLGYAPDDGAPGEIGGMMSADALRRSPAENNSGPLLDKLLRYAAVLQEERIGVTHVFELNGAPCLYFKSLASEPTEEQIRCWHRTVWNHGLGRMLWIVTPKTVRILNAFQPPESEKLLHRKHPAELLKAATSDLERLRKLELDRISLESGQFWMTKAGRRIKKADRIDEQLVKDLEQALELLKRRGCVGLKAHRLMLRTLFTAYLEARRVLPPHLFDGLGTKSFADVLKNPAATATFFERMRETFNGDLFPPPPKAKEADESYLFSESQLDVARSIVIRRNLTTGQQVFDFSRYDFEVIPIELISSIYERFIYAGDPVLARERGTHYTPVNLVDLVFSQIFDDDLFDTPLGDKPKVLDLACGSGVFLVEAFRRLLSRRVAGGEKWTRTLVREILSNQLYGVDLEESAIEIAAFSLCLTAFELDPSPDSVNQLKFRESLKGKNLFVGDAFATEGFTTQQQFAKKEFAVVVGNPPWKKTSGSKSSEETVARSHIAFCANQEPPIQLPFRSPIDQAFIWRSRYFAKPGGRFGLIIDAKNFFSQEEQSVASRKQLFSTLRSRVMMNLSALHNKRLFPSAEQPAMVFVAENAEPQTNDAVVFASAERSDTFRRHGIVELFIERVNHLPLRKVASEAHLLKIAAHGTPRDHAIITYLFAHFSTVAEIAAGLNTDLFQGFIRGNSARTVSARVRSLPMLEASDLHRWRHTADGLAKMKYTHLQWPRDPNIYRGPLLLVKQSLQNDRLVAAVCEDDLAYSGTYFGIPLGDSPEHYGKAIAAICNSALATYCFFLTATRFGIDKQIAMPNDIARLPIPMLKEPSNAGSLVREFDLRNSGNVSAESFESLDDAVFDFFQTERWQREYILDVLKFDLDFVRHGSSSIAVSPPDENQLKVYSATILQEIRSNLSDASLKVNADIVGGLEELCCVVVRFDETRNRSVRIVVKGDFDSSSKLAELLHAPLTSSFQLRRSLIMFDENRCIIVKHAQKRFWSRARAYDDADTVFAELARP